MGKKITKSFVKTARRLLAKTGDNPWSIKVEECEGGDNIIWMMCGEDTLSKVDAELIVFMRDYFKQLVDLAEDSLSGGLGAKNVKS